MNLFPLGIVNFFSSGDMTAYRRKEADAARFFKATARPRFLLAGHIRELFFPYEGPGQTLLKMLRTSGYHEGETIFWEKISSVDVATVKYFLTQATFELNNGRPGEMLDALFRPKEEAIWLLTFKKRAIENFVLIEEDRLGFGFWPEGPNPFNRRWKTLKTHPVYLYRKKDFKKKGGS
jgi:hypothetical protein